MPTKDTDGTYRTRRRTPGYGSGSLVLRLGTRDAKVAAKRESLLVDCYEAGAHDIIDALRSRELAWTTAMKHKTSGVPAIREALEAQRVAKAAVEHDAEPLLEEYKKAKKNDIGDKQITKNGGAVRRFIARLRERHKLEADDPVPISLFTRENLRVHRNLLVEEEHEKTEAKLRAEWSEAPNPLPKPEQDRILEKARGSKRATANRHVNAVGAFCVWVMEAYPGVLPASPAEGVRWSMGEENPLREDTYRYLTPAQLRVVFEYAQKYDAANPAPEGVAVPDELFWRYLAATGATTFTEGTWFELRHIERGQEADDMVPVYVHGTKSQYRARWVPVARELVDDLERRAKDLGIGKGRPLFPFTHKQYMDVWHGMMGLIRAEEPEGWQEIVQAAPYDVRHSFAVGAVRAGVDLAQLMDLMGHNNITTTMMYARHRESANKALAALATQLR